MSKYSEAVVAVKPEFSYLETSKPLRETYNDGTINKYNPEAFPYAKKFMYTLLNKVNDTYAAFTEPASREQLCWELYQQLAHDFRFDFSDHLGGMRQRDKRGADVKAEENDYNMFHSCYKFVNQAARARSLGEKFNLSLMSGRVNTDNQTGPEICDPFVFGPAMYLYSKAYPKVVAFTLPGFDTEEKIATLNAHEKEMKKDMLNKKAQAAKALKSKWHFLINQKFIPEGLKFKDLTADTVKNLAELHKNMLTELSEAVETHFQNDVKMLKKVTNVLRKQMEYNQDKAILPNELSSRQLASLHAMQANEALKNSSVVQVSIEAEKPIFEFMAEVLEDDNSLSSQIFDNENTRKIFEEEMEKIHTTKDGMSYGSLLDKLEPVNCTKIPDYARVLGGEYSEKADRKQMAQALRSGNALPKVSFMLAIVLLETGAKVEGGSSQIVYARKIKEGLDKVLAEAEKFEEFNHEDVAKRREIIAKFDYRTAQAQMWGVKTNGEVLSYRNLVDGSIKIDDDLLDKVADISSQDAFDAAAVHRFYTFAAKQKMSEEEFEQQKERVKGNLLQFQDKGDYEYLLAENSPLYQKLAEVIRNDEMVKQHNAQLIYQHKAANVVGW